MKIYSYFLILISMALMNGCTSNIKAASSVSPQNPNLGQLDNIIKSGDLSREDTINLWNDALMNYHAGANEQVVKYLIANVGVNVILDSGTPTAVLNMTPLMLACSNSQNSEAIFRLLINGGANINEQYQFKSSDRFGEIIVFDGSSALHFCMGEFRQLIHDPQGKNYYINPAGAKLLIASGARLDIKNKRGRTPNDSYASGQRIWAAKKNESSTGGLDFGQVLALASGAVLADSSSLSGAQKAEFMTNYTADVLTDNGGTNTRNWGNQQTQLAQSGQGSAGNGLNSGSGLPSLSGGGNLSLSCMGNGACGDYTFSSQEDFNDFKSRCPKVLGSSCPAGPACKHRSAGRTVTTYVYNLARETVRKTCTAEAGEFVD